jgi:hypothetical protein
VRIRTTLLYALPLLLVLVAVGFGLANRPGARHLALPPVEAPQAAAQACTALLTALPSELPANPDELPRLELAEPAPAGARAWGTATQGPVVLRCGLPRPAELAPGAAIVSVDGVNWLTLSEPDRDTFITADRPVYVAITVPRGLGSGPVQAVSDTVRAAVPTG